MRARPAWLGAFLAFSIGATGAACFDLFHSTAGIQTACELDPSTPGCICLPRDEAQARASQACAWLGACEGPIGRNSFGACVLQARMAYDCDANPNHAVKGEANRLWQCLGQAKTCSAVDACILPDSPDGKPPCVPAGGSCIGSPDGGASGSVRLVCAPSDAVDSGSTEISDAAAPMTAMAEVCALFGQTCSMSADGAVCTGSAGATGCPSNADECPREGSAALYSCNQDGVDLGIDCASNGSQDCRPYSGADGSGWVACAAEGDTLCDPSLTVTCNGGVATSCTSGVVETIDCTALLGSAAICVPGTLNPTFDWTSPCEAGVSQCSTDLCDDAGGITGCMRGATTSVDCAAQALNPCAVVDVGAGLQAAACTQP
jgi:hypothetical protein